MYAQAGLSPGLSAIEVAAPRGRTPYLLREYLDDDLARDASTPAVWRLDLQIDQTRIALGLTANDVAERYQLGVRVRYSLVELATGRIATSGAVASEVSYDTADPPYAGIAARQDGQRRAAEDAARRIQLALSTWLYRHHDGSP